MGKFHILGGGFRKILVKTAQGQESFATDRHVATPIGAALHVGNSVLKGIVSSIWNRRSAFHEINRRVAGSVAESSNPFLAGNTIIVDETNPFSLGMMRSVIAVGRGTSRRALHPSRPRKLRAHHGFGGLRPGIIRDDHLVRIRLGQLHTGAKTFKASSQEVVATAGGNYDGKFKRGHGGSFSCVSKVSVSGVEPAKTYKSSD